MICKSTKLNIKNALTQKHEKFMLVTMRVVTVGKFIHLFQIPRRNIYNHKM